MEFADDPFQMDEDLDPEPEPSLSQPAGDFWKACTSTSEDQQSQDVSSGLKQLLSRTTSSKLHGTYTPTEEDKIIYEEDIDDLFDGEAAKSNAEQLSCKDLHAAAEPDETLAPPENFAPVINKIYRSSFPQSQSFAFLKKLKLTSVLCLIPEEYPQAQQEFFEKEGIKLFQLEMSGNKEPFVKISSELVTKAMMIVIDPANQPILIHCNRGKHRTGCLVGVIRRLQGWSLTIIFDEYRKFAAPKERPMDQQFIELYDESRIIEYAEENGFLPMAWL